MLDRFRVPSFVPCGVEFELQFACCRMPVIEHESEEDIRIGRYLSSSMT